MLFRSADDGAVDATGARRAQIGEAGAVGRGHRVGTHGKLARELAAEREAGGVRTVARVFVERGLVHIPAIAADGEISVSIVAAGAF